MTRTCFSTTMRTSRSLFLCWAVTPTHIVNDEEYPIQKGDVFVINENTSHAYKDPRHFRICNIMFQPDYFLKNFGDIKSLPGYHSLFVIEPALTQQNGFQSRIHLAPDVFDTFDQMITRIHHEYVSHSAGYQTMTSGLFLQMITSLSRLFDKSEEADDNTVSLANTIAYMEFHFREDISVEELAPCPACRPVISGVSSTRSTAPVPEISAHTAHPLCRTPLRSTDLPVTEIAIRSRYPDGNYFSGKFKQFMGMPPLKYRNDPSQG